MYATLSLPQIIVFSIIGVTYIGMAVALAVIPYKWKDRRSTQEQR